MGYKLRQFDGHEVMLKLADPTFANRDRYALQLTCRFCSGIELKIYQQFHYCPSIPGSKTKILADTFPCQWLLYPHDVYDLLPAADQDTILASGDFETEDAAAVIRRSFLPQVIKDQLPEKLELGLVFYARDENIATRQHWKYTMALDRYLTHFNRAKFSAAGGPTQEGIACDRFGKHIDRHGDKPMPVLTIRCGAGMNDPRKKTKTKEEEDDEEEEEDDADEDDESDDDNDEYEDTDEEEELEDEDEESENEDEDEDADEDEGEEVEQDIRPCPLFDIHFPYTDDPVDDGEECTPEVAEHVCWESDHVHALINPGIDICNILEFPAPMARYYWLKARASEHSGAKVTREIRDGASHKILKWQVAEEVRLSYKLASEQNWEN
ncbi:hypothetical protein BGZ81_006928 [Podila clonocystis]|nr:hypothetical protein BGZ81_006928 [Podila clonocystis]